MFKERVEQIVDNEKISILRKFQLVGVEMLDEVHKICEENNIQYWIDAGTLLGAIRHDGFIPWDDDIDICVPRKDYEKLKELFEQGLLPEGIVYEDKYTNTWYQDEMNLKPSFMKLYYLDHFKGYDHHEDANWKGVFIDIFPVDEVTEEMCKSKKNILIRILSRRVMKKQKGIINNIKMILGKLNLEKLWIKQCEKVIGTEEAKYIIYGVETPFMEYKYLQNKCDIYPTKEVIFEGRTLLAPNNPHNYLIKQYGDYMVIPKEEDRHTHLSDLKI